MTRPLAAILVAAALAGCTGPGAESGRTEGDVRSEPGATESAGLLPPVERPESPVATLANGTHSVFGLRIPGGMTPVPGPHKVYRFEGSHSLTVVKRQVMRQVETGTIVEEPTGFLIRRARVLRPIGETDPATRVAVRIFRGRKGGATLDVWVEPAAVSARRGGRGGQMGGSGANGRSPDDKPTVLDGTGKRRRQQQRRQTLDALEKLQRGEQIGQAEADNPLFY